MLNKKSAGQSILGLNRCNENFVLEGWQHLAGKVTNYFYSSDKPYTTGGVVIVTHNKETVFSAGYGCANREFDQPWSTSTRFPIASITKTMIAQIVLMLSDDGIVDINSVISDHVTWFPHVGDKVSIRDLLTMTSGLDWDEELIWLSGHSTGTLPFGDAITIEETCRFVGRQTTLATVPGDYQIYSDTGYRLLGCLIEKWCGKPLHVVFEEKIVKPCNLSSAILSKDYRLHFDNLALPYASSGGDLPPRRAEYHAALGGDGAVIASAKDVMQWLQLSIHGSGSFPSIFDRQCAITAPRPDGTPASYRAGVRVDQHRGMQCFGHGGVFGSYYVYVPDHQLSVVVFTNELGRLDRANAVAAALDGTMDVLNIKDTGDPVFYRPRKGLTLPTPEALIGLFGDPATGDLVEGTNDENGDFAFRWLGKSLYPDSSRDGILATCPWEAPVLEVASPADDFIDVRLDSQGWRRLKRLWSMATIPSDICGTYLTPNHRSLMTIRQHNSALQLVLGGALVGGQTLDLEAFDETLFAVRRNSKLYASLRYEECEGRRWICLRTATLGELRAEKVTQPFSPNEQHD
jgi:CubicO group peptidase (beta-lactamase class C family)